MENDLAFRKFYTMVTYLLGTSFSFRLSLFKRIRNDSASLANVSNVSGATVIFTLLVHVPSSLAAFASQDVVESGSAPTPSLAVEFILASGIYAIDPSANLLIRVSISEIVNESQRIRKIKFAKLCSPIDRSTEAHKPFQTGRKQHKKLSAGTRE